MAEENSYQGGAGSCSGKTSDRLVNPDLIPEAVEEPGTSSKPEVKKIPIAMPISPEEFKKLKRTAEQPSDPNQVMQSDED